MKAKMIGWHRRFALISAVAVLLWGVSGLLHPLMSWTNPRPVSFMPPTAETFSLNKDVRNILQRNEIPQVTGLRIVDGQLQVSVPGDGERFYFDLKSGQPIPDADRDRAIRVARHYTGLTEAPITGARLVTEFSNQYTYINRYLPVWKITFDDPRHISVYVDTDTDRLGAITDTRKVILQTLFQTVHTGQWLEGLEPLRLALIALLVGSALSMAVAGLYMLVRIRGSRKGVRKFHRVLAYAALFPLLMFPVSGLFHLFVQSPLLYGDHDAEPVVLDVSTIKFMPTGKADEVRFVAPAWWRVQSGKDVTYKNFIDGSTLKGDKAFVRQAVPGEIKGVTLVTSFSDEYGFAYKRLPVWRVDTGHGLTFIEARTGVVAAQVDPLKIAETWSFSRFHKWQFLDGVSEQVMGKGPYKTALRDVVMVTFVLMGLGMAVLGLMIRRRS